MERFFHHINTMPCGPGHGILAPPTLSLACIFPGRGWLAIMNQVGFLAELLNFAAGGFFAQSAESPA